MLYGVMEILGEVCGPGLARDITGYLERDFGKGEVIIIRTF